MNVRNPASASSGSTPLREIYSVSRLNREAKTLLEGSFSLLWVEGEISNLARPSSGHLYFSLKDSQAQVRCALFRGNQRAIACVPRDGMHVVARARASLYEGRGEFQLIVEHIEEAGEGALRRAFEALKIRLSQEGLFDIAHKKPLPRLPRRIGVITSPSGAAIRDIITTLKLRFPAISVLIYPVPVQGEGAAEKIAAAIRLAERFGDCDALILARGGGSLEDLWPFNEEIVARALYDCPLPVVSGVGHETDFTIADLVADARAPTPTAAAVMLSPDQQEWLAEFADRENRLRRLMIDRLRNSQQRLDWVAARLAHPREGIRRLQQRLIDLARRITLAQAARRQRAAANLLDITAHLYRRSPDTLIRQLQLRFDHQQNRLVLAMQQILERAAHRLNATSRHLDALSPLATLARGYAIVQRDDTGTVVHNAAQLKPGDRIRAVLAHGQVTAKVEDTKK
ncbi:MAG: exodeoxyribonuclease VII large subunit [Acidiferrobacterales bacterium]